MYLMLKLHDIQARITIKPESGMLVILDKTDSHWGWLFLFPLKVQAVMGDCDYPNRGNKNKQQKIILDLKKMNT